MNTSCPLLLVGLGAVGAAAAGTAYRGVRETRPGGAPPVVGVGLDKSALRLLDPAAPPQEPDAGSPGEAERPPADDVDPTVLVELTLEPAVSQGVWGRNAAAVRNTRLPLARALARQVRAIRRAGAGQRAAPDVGEQVHVVVYSTLDDAVGSASLLPVLEALGEVFRTSLPDLPHTLQVVLLFPDLVPEADPSHAPRVYACLRELEVAVENGGGPGGPAAVDRFWLLSSRNADDLFVRTYEELSGAFTGHAVATLRGMLWQGPSCVAVHHRHVHGRRARYGTFGFGRLVFPREELVRAALDWTVGTALDTMPALRAVQIAQEEVTARVQPFLMSQGLTRLPDLLRVDSADTELFRAFEPPPHPPESQDGTFAPCLTEALLEYECTTRPEMIGALARRSEEVRRAVQEGIRGSVAARLAGGRPGAFATALAWLAALTGDLAGNESGDTSRLTGTVRGAAESAFFSYFEPQIEAARFGAPQGGVPRREQKRRIELDLSSKNRLLEQALEEIARREGAAAPTDENPDAERPGVPGDTERDLAIRHAVARAAEAQRATRARVELETLRPRAEQLQAEVDALTADLYRVTAEVEAIEKAVRDPGERRALLERQHTEARERSQTLYAEHDRSLSTLAEASRSVARAEARARRWRIGLAPSALTGTAALGAMTGGLLVVAGVLVLALGTAGAYWFVAAVPLRLAREALHTARATRDRIRREVEDVHRRMIRTDFEHILHSMLADWGNALTAFVREDLAEKLRSMREALHERGGAAFVRSARLNLPDEGGIDYLLPTDGVAHVVALHGEQLTAASEAVLRRTDLPELFDRYRASDEALDTLEGEIREAGRRALGTFPASTIDDFLVQLHPTPRERVARLERFHGSAAPLGRKMFPVAADPSLSLQGLSVGTSPEQSVVAQGLRQAGHQPLVTVGETETEVALLRVTTGFAGFQFAGLEEARERYCDLGIEERHGYSAGPPDAESTPDLFPAPLRERGHDRDVCALAERALAEGVAIRRPADQGVDYGSHHFLSLEAWTSYLDGPSGTWMLQRLREEVGTPGRCPDEVALPSYA